MNCFNNAGSLLDENSDIFKTPIMRPKEKQLLFDSVLESISNFAKLDECLQLDVDSGMGFLIGSYGYWSSGQETIHFDFLPQTNSSSFQLSTCFRCCMLSRCKRKNRGVECRAVAKK